jgi:pyruvate formate lyase activating enzyme
MRIAEISNFQSLNDWPGKVVFPILIHGCNFKCPFCFVPHLFCQGKYEENILDKIKSLDRNFYDAILISGGEPTLCPELPDFLKHINGLNWPVRLFTNGSNPEMLKLLVEEKLVDSIAMDIKHIKNQEKYNEASGVQVNLEDIEKSMKIISQLKDYEFRTTLVKKFHKKEDALEIARWIKKVTGKLNYRVQNFYNRADSYVDKNIKNEEQFSDQEIAEINKLIQSFFS